MRRGQRGVQHVVPLSDVKPITRTELTLLFPRLARSCDSESAKYRLLKMSAPLGEGHAAHKLDQIAFARPIHGNL